jgi:L-threonylcarbamoyladenylate synthase
MTAETLRVDERQALEVLSADGLVAFPTETVWGLAARAESPRAVSLLRAFKGRDAAKPVAVLIDGPGRLSEIGVELSQSAARLADAFWPGPLTLVATCSRALAPGVLAEDGTVGIRCSSHPVAAALAGGALDRGLGPVTATSLNRSGGEAARSADDALRIAALEPGIVVTRGEAGGAEPSTVVDTTGSQLRVLREGAISERALRRAESRSAATSEPESPFR